MMQEVHEKRKGIEIGGYSYNNLRYADDAVVVTDKCMYTVSQKMHQL